MNIIISNSSQDPIYVQIRKQLSQLILNGGLKGETNYRLFVA